MRADATALARKALEAASQYLDVTDGEQVFDDVRVVVTDRAVAAAETVLKAELVDPPA